GVGVPGQRDPAVPGDHQPQPDQPQVRAFLLGLAPLGDRRVQDTSGERGDVTPVACTVTITNPGTQNSVLNTAITPLPIVATSNYPTGSVTYSASNLPKGLSIDQATGKITGTPTKTGTSVVTVGATDTPSPYNTTTCKGSAQFNWTVSLTAPSPSPSSSPTAPTTVPVGGVQTGGGMPISSPWLAAGLFLLVFGGLGLAGAVVSVRRQRG
ncbi:MAG: Ig domain-containing protein, partial [Streptosporangiaceae bacterium]